MNKEKRTIKITLQSRILANWASSALLARRLAQIPSCSVAPPFVPPRIQAMSWFSESIVDETPGGSPACWRPWLCPILR